MELHERKKLTLKNFGVGLLAIVGFPVWFPLIVVVFVIGMICEIGRAVVHFGEAD